MDLRYGEKAAILLSQVETKKITDTEKRYGGLFKSNNTWIVFRGKGNDYFQEEYSDIMKAILYLITDYDLDSLSECEPDYTINDSCGAISSVHIEEDFVQMNIMLRKNKVLISYYVNAGNMLMQTIE